MAEQRPALCDYEGSDYRTAFWEGQGRDYEDRAERIAIKRLLPSPGRRLIDLGAGFGRLVPLYGGYAQVVLFDYSRSQLEYARQTYGDQGMLYVAGNIYSMPFAPGQFDAALMVRVLHHMQDAPAALRAVRQIMKQQGVFVLEFANKRNLKAVARWLLRRQSWNPFDRDPVEFAEMHFDFHPAYVRETLQSVGFAPGRMLTVSHFRLDLLKRTIPAGLLAALDAAAQWTGPLWQLSPSVFVRSTALGAIEPAPEGAFWRCPACRSFDMQAIDEGITCGGCGARWGRVNGIYDFKAPLEVG
jgi:SAM-dependent methyltransferase